MPSEIVPILALSGHSPGASVSKFACASLQAVCPSAASGLIVSPGGRVTITDFACEGDGVKPSVWGTLKLRFSPEAAVGLGGGQAGAEHRVEGLLLAPGDRRVFGLRMAQVVRVLVGLDVEFGDAAAAPVQVVG